MHSQDLGHDLFIQAYVVLLPCTLLHFTDVLFFTSWRQDPPPPAERLQLALLQWSRIKLAVPSEVCLHLFFIVCFFKE